MNYLVQIFYNYCNKCKSADFYKNWSFGTFYVEILFLDFCLLKYGQQLRNDSLYFI